MRNLLKIGKAILLWGLLLATGCGERSVAEEAAPAFMMEEAQEENPGPVEETEIINGISEISDPTPAPSATPVPDRIYKARIAAVGDLMVHTWQLNDAYDPATGAYDFGNDFEMVQAYLDTADYRIGNLETVFAGEAVGYSDFPMFNTPDSFGQAIKDAGFNLLTTANNHSLDKGGQGLVRTLDILDGLEIAHVGTYRTQEARDTVLLADINGIRVAFLAYTYGTNGIPIPQTYNINLISEGLIISDLEKAKALNPDLIVVMPHMGNEYETYPKDVFKNWVDMMLYNGADIVLASHPHVLQPMEMKTITDNDGAARDVFVIYSLGNFISSQRTEPRDAGMILNIEVSKRNEEKAVIDKVTFVPTWVQFKNQQGQDYVRVLPVADVLHAYGEGVANNLRPKDLDRLRRVHSEITSMYLGQSVPPEEMQREYTFYKRVPYPIHGVEE